MNYVILYMLFSFTILSVIHYLNDDVSDYSPSIRATAVLIIIWPLLLVAFVLFLVYELLVSELFR